MFLLFTVVFSTDLLRLLGGIARRVAAAQPIDPQRRTLLARLTAGATGVLVSGLAGAALRSAQKPVDVRKVSVRLDRLPRAQDGFRIVQLTDIHVGPTIGRAFVEEIVERANALAPDLVAITGDLVDGTVRQLAAAIEPLAGLRAPHGVYFVTGNHEYFSGAEDWLNELNRLGIRTLRNERVSIDNGTVGFDLAGVDNRSAIHYGGLSPKRPSDVPSASRSRSRAGPVGAPASDAPRRRALRRGTSALWSHPRRPNVAVQLRGRTAATFRGGPSSPRERPDLRQPWHRLLGASNAARRASRNHRDSVGEWASRNAARLINLRTARRRALPRVPPSGPSRASRTSNDGKVGDRQRDGPIGPSAHETDDDPGPDLLLGDEVDQIGRRRHLVLVDRRNDVSPAQTRTPGRSVIARRGSPEHRCPGSAPRCAARPHRGPADRAARRRCTGAARDPL